MVSSLAMLGIGCTLLASSLALPPNRMIATSVPKPAGRSVSSRAGNLDPLTLLDLPLNTSITTPRPSESPVGSWAIECGRDNTPPGWAVPPETHQIARPTDCRSAISRVIRGGEPWEPQIWTSQANWSFRSCGVFLAPGWSYARVNFPRIDMAEIAQEIARMCVTQEYEFMGGWVAIGGYFILLLTGSEAPERQR